MSLLARIELLEEIAEGLQKDFADTRDALRSTAEALQFPYERVVEIWRHELGGQPLDYGGSLLLLNAVRRAKTDCQTSG